MSVLAHVGNTPLVRLERLSPRPEIQIWAKLESQNPGGSVKDRIALNMVLAAEREGKLEPGGTIVEPTSGNTGIGLAMVGAARGYRVALTMPESMSMERRKLLTGYGAEMILTAKENGMKGAIAEAERLVMEEGFFMPNQFQNPANPQAHRLHTGPEILHQCPAPIDYLVAGVGTGGTITGAGEVIRTAYPGLQVVAVEPAGSPVLSGGEAGPHKIMGIGAGFVPGVMNTALLSRVIQVGDDESFETARRLAREEGLMVGISSGAAVAACLKLARELKDPAVMVTFLPSTGERYISTELFS